MTNVLPFRRINSDLADPWPNITSSSLNFTSSVADNCDEDDNDVVEAVVDMLLLLSLLLYVSLEAGWKELVVDVNEG